jgi:hypothetical protein
MVAHACNPNTEEAAEAVGDCELHSETLTQK